MATKKSKTSILISIISLVAMLLALITILILSISKPQLTYEQKVAVFQEENKTLKKGQIVFIGDSITQNYLLSSHYSDLALECYNRGISGDTIDWLLYRLQVSLFDIEPSKVVLMIGTNDINNEKSTQEMTENYKNILSLISSNLTNAEVFCVSIIPQNLQHSQNALNLNEKIIATNIEIKKMANEYNYVYVNLYDRLIDQNGLLSQNYSFDGLHLNNNGYAVWTIEMKEVLI